MLLLAPTRIVHCSPYLCISYIYISVLGVHTGTGVHSMCIQGTMGTIRHLKD